MLVRSLPEGFYRSLMDVGFRRSGRLVYQPVCAGCFECVPLRVPVQTFVPSKSQRRCRRRNSDLRVDVATPSPDDEKYALYQRYIRDWHSPEPAAASPTREAFESFLYQSPVPTLEFCYRNPDGRLMAVGICDVDDVSLSSVYFYFEPIESRRGLGTFGAVLELEWCNANAKQWYYLGYHVKQCLGMSYKSNFRPNQLLGRDGQWYDFNGRLYSPH